MFPSTRRTIAILFKTPLVPVSSAPPALELTTMTRAGPSRPRAATRTYSNMSFRSVAQVEAYGNGNSMSRRGYASDHGKKELYSDEAGSSGAGTDDVAHSDAAFNKDPNPESAAKDIEKETGKDYTKRSPANASSSEPMNQQGKPGTVDNPKLTSNSEAKKH